MMSEWINVDDRLPDFSQVVLVWGCDEYPINAFRAASIMESHKWLEYSDIFSDLVGITHWMPLPEPPDANQ